MIPWHTSPIKEPEFAGRFYPDAKKELLNEIDHLFRNAKIREDLNSIPQALISPHAGYVFSGQVAASSFNQIPDQACFNKVFVIASSHQMHFNGASIYTNGHYKTPLGIIKVDLELAKQLTDSNKLFLDKPDAHDFEHSLEVQLPFIQFKLKNEFQLVPIILGTNSPTECREIAKALAPYFTPDNLFIISTDFSHYPNYEDAYNVDSITADSVISNNPQYLLNTLKSNKNPKIPNLSTSMCGWTSVLTLMYLTENKPFEYRKVDYMNSGDNILYGGKDRVVGYCAIAVYLKNESIFYISETEKTTMLKLARRALNSSYGIKKFEITGLDLNGIPTSNIGAFVSLYLGKELMGCIGQFESEKPLWEVISKIVVSAANDRRFKKPEAKILDKLLIEISVLSPMKKIESIDEIVLGRHGIYIKSGFNSGTFLPQVATKTGWSKEEFLGHCSSDKAGLGWDGWKKAEIYIFEAVVFRDKEIR